jgi:hypothetical protein
LKRSETASPRRKRVNQGLQLKSIVQQTSKCTKTPAASVETL